MPTGVSVPGALLVDSAGSPDLASASLETPDSLASTLAAESHLAAKGAEVEPVPEIFSEVGVPAYGHDLAVFERIHVLPRERDLGPVGTEVEVEVEVWNAFRSLARILTDVTLTGASGVEVVDEGQSSHFPATESQIYKVRISAEGEPLIDSVVTWVFTGVATEGTTFHLLGFRVIPFAFPPNMERPIVERFGYLTDILVFHDGTEQRVQLRATPVGSIGYSTLLADRREAQMANAILYGQQARPFGVGRWQFQTTLTAEAFADDLEILCDTTDLPFEVDGLVLIWKTPFLWEAHTLTDVQADRLVLRLGLRDGWPIGTKVYPMVLGRLPADQPFSWEGLAIGSQELVFQVDGFRP